MTTEESLPTQTHTATVIWLHGIGDSGVSWLFLSSQLGKQFPHVKWIFPNAPVRSISCYDGIEMPAWFDVSTFSFDNNVDHIDSDSMKESVAKVNTLIENEIKAGIPIQRIILGGFSQGCIISLLTALFSHHALGGIIGCSGCLVGKNQIKVFGQPVKKSTPILMLHGSKDLVIPSKYGALSFHHMKAMGYNAVFYEYPELAHSFEDDQVLQVARFLKEHIPTLSTKL
ncbi:Phospholipase/carboxylesterase/thioesterase [Phycomyces nitens]|nr:Phospholipase/carboxylesterase/thioesterase [Phycomyces nitens]